MTKFFSILCIVLSGCYNLPQNYPGEDPNIESGAMCQGSRDWKEHNICQPNQNSGLCIRVVEGPITITRIHTTAYCPHSFYIGIKDTYLDSDINQRPRWNLHVDPMHPMIITAPIEIKAGESLFVGTDGFNNTVDSNCCYITWVGRREK